MTFLRKVGGGYVFTPRQSENHPGHFQTWHELATQALSGKLEELTLDNGLGSTLNFQRICMDGKCHKVFQSAADRDRHNRLVH